MDLVKIQSIVDYLVSEKLLVRVSDENALGQQVSSLKGIGEAGSKDLSWLSEKKAKSDPSVITRFKGAALICSPEIPSSENASFLMICVTNPKLAFAQIASRFFPQATETRFPTHDSPAISPDAKIGQGVVLGHGVVIGAGVNIADNVKIGPNSVILNCSIEANVTIGANCTFGLPGFGYVANEQGVHYRFPHVGGIRIASHCEIGSNTCIDRGSLGDTILEEHCKIDNLVHIAHNVHVKKNAVIIANAMIGGSTVIDEGAWIAPSASLMNQLHIGKNSIVGLGAVVVKSVEENNTVVGNPAKPLK